MNQIILYGRVVKIDVKKKSFEISVPRSYLTNDEVKYDIITCTSFSNINKNITSYINVDDSVLIKGRLEEDDGSYHVRVEHYQVLKRKV